MTKISNLRANRSRGGCTISSKLTDGCDDGGREEERSCKLPLEAGLVRNELDDVRRDHPHILLRDVVLDGEVPLLLQQFLAFLDLVLRLERVEDGGADEKVRKRADDQRQRPYVLLLHLRPARCFCCCGGCCCWW